MDLEGECTTRTASVFQLKRKRGKDSFNAESNSRFFWRFSMEAQTEKRIDNPRFIYPYHGLAIRLLLSGGVECAISINTISSKIIRRYCDDFKCGIGIDYGEMYVHKTGIIKQGKEASSYKNLIWIGRPANIASRLTDIANKELSETIFRVTRKLKNPRAYRHKDQGYTYLPSSLLGPLERVHNEPLYLDKEETVEMSIEEFSNSIWQSESTGEISTLNGKMVHFEKDIRNFSQKPILMTQSVYNGFMNETPNHSTISKKYWQEVKADIRDYEGKVWGGDIVWSSVKDINS